MSLTLGNGDSHHPRPGVSPVSDKPAPRKAWVDETRGVAISLVVIGHVIQYGAHGRFDYFVNPVFTTIYSFHMPLFMFLSGFVAYRSAARLSPGQLFTTRLRSLVLPFLTWAILGGMIFAAIQARSFVQLDVRTVVDRIMSAVLYPESSLWFLWVLFLCYAALALSKCAPSRMQGPALVLLTVAAFFIPFDELLAGTQLKWLLPFFVLGYAAFPLQSRLTRWRLAGTIAALALYFLLRLAWTRGDSVYLNRMKPEGTIPSTAISYGYRYLVALVGTIAVIGLVRLLSPHIRLTLFRLLGVKTLGVYAFQTYLVLLLPRLPSPDGWGFAVVYVPLVATAILLASWGGTALAQRWRPTRTLLLGGR